MIPLLLACVPPRFDFQSGDLHDIEILEHGGLERRFRYYESQQSGDRPLVIVLHGGGATLESFVVESGVGASPFAGVWLDLADAEGFHVAFPEGWDSHWNCCRGDCDHCGDADDAGFLFALVDELDQRLAIDPARIHLAGESNGGFLTERMAQEHGGRFGSVGVVIAAMPAVNECTDAREPLSLVYVVGTADETVPFEGGLSAYEPSGTSLSSDETVDHWVELAACDPTPAVTPVPDLDPDDGATAEIHTWSCPDGREIRRVVVEGGGHVVPSIDQHTSAWWNSMAGAQSHDVETAAEMWRFFDAHPLGG